MAESITVTVITETAKFLSRWFRSTIIEGRVINSQDEPLAGITVYLDDIEEVNTSIDGGFVFEVLKPGIKKISILHNDCMIDNVKQFHISKGDKTSITVKIPTIQEVEPAIISGDLLDLQNNPISGVQVEIDGVKDTTSHLGGFMLEVKNHGIFQLNLTYNENELRNVKKVHISKQRDNVTFRLQVDLSSLFPSKNEPVVDSTDLEVLRKKMQAKSVSLENKSLSIERERTIVPSEKTSLYSEQIPTSNNSLTPNSSRDNENKNVKLETKSERRKSVVNGSRDKYREGWKRQIREHQNDYFRCPECNSDVKGSNFLRHWDKHNEITTKLIPKKLSRVIPRNNEESDSGILESFFGIFKS